MDSTKLSTFEKQLRYAYLSNDRKVLLDFYKAHYPLDFFNKASKLPDKTLFGMANKFIYNTSYFDRDEKIVAKAWLDEHNFTTEMSLVSH